MSGLRIDTDVEMTTRDGVVLRSDVYRPDDDLPRPVLLHRTPYDKANPNLVTVLIADPVEWAAAQEWSDGQVGVYGSSYRAITAYAALAAAPPHLSAVFAMIGAADLATTVRPGGLLELGFLASYSLGQVVEQVRRSERKPEEKHALVGRVLSALADPSRTVARTPLADLDVLADPELAPWRSTWLHDEAGDHVTRSLGREQPLPDVPLMSVSGFRDFMQASMISVFERRRPSERHRLVAGPWAHNGAYTGHVGARFFAGAPGGVATWQPVIQGWFDRWLKNDPGRVAQPWAKGVLDGPPVTWFSTGSERWQAGPVWPPADVDDVAWNLSRGGLLARAEGMGSTRYRHAPDDPVPTTGGVFTAPALGPDGIQDQTARQARADVAVWTSDVLTTPVEVAGSASLTVHLACSGEDTDLVVVLSDVGPDGFVANVAEGALRARTRLGGIDAWLVPGQVTELTVSLHHTAHVFATGHRIRVDLAGSSFPRFSRNFGTREVPELGRIADAVVTEQVVRHDPTHRSRLCLPTLG